MAGVMGGAAEAADLVKTTEAARSTRIFNVNTTNDLATAS
jgi:hypothetical protein